MNILLINPRTEGTMSSELPARIAKEVGLFPPLGLLYLAGYLQRYSRHEVTLLDMPAEGCSYDQLAGRVKKEKPGIVGITAITHNLVDVQRAARSVKDASPETVVCLGGPHVDAFPAESLALPAVDYAIRGEGELAFLAFVEAVDGKGALDAIPGLIHRQGSAVVQNPCGELVQDLDALPFPARALIDPSRYRYVLGTPTPFTTLITSRGCPFGCIFCSTPHGTHRFRSARNIVDEMEACLQRGPTEFHLVDDTFNVTAGRLAALSEAIMERKLSVSWSCRARVNGLRLEEMKLAKRAGCKRIHFGIETGTDEGLKGLCKGITTDQARQAVAWAREAGIDTAAYFLIGCPHEKTRRDVMRTVKFACDIDPDFAMFNILAIYPKTKLFDMGIRQGLIEPDYWAAFARNPQPGFQVRFWEEHFTRRELEVLVRTAYRKFYFRPAPMFRQLRQIDSFGELWRRASAALGILSRGGS